MPQSSSGSSISDIPGAGVPAAHPTKLDHKWLQTYKLNDRRCLHSILSSSLHIVWQWHCTRCQARASDSSRAAALLKKVSPRFWTQGRPRTQSRRPRLRRGGLGIELGGGGSSMRRSEPTPGPKHSQHISFPLPISLPPFKGRFLEKGSVFSRGLPLPRKRFPSRENASSREETLPLSRKRLPEFLWF
jgi:hypothetical protein